MESEDSLKPKSVISFYIKKQGLTMRITYDESFKNRIIDNVGLRKGSNGYLFDKKTSKPIRDINGDFVKYDQFGGFHKGSVQYVKSDLTSLIALSKSIRASK
jgi:nucleoside-specific outer membrane channel protein Tsx